MRIAILAKERYLGKGLPADRYGRYYEIPLALSRMGHVVCVVVAQYRPRPAANDLGDDGVVWHLVPWHEWRKGGPVSGVRMAFRYLNHAWPDVIVGCADALQVILGYWAARRLGRPFVADLYDNYESYGLTHMPMVAWAHRYSLARARAVMCVSHPLAEKIAGGRKISGPVTVVGNAVPEGMFGFMEKAAARRMLGLPQEKKLIGTGGALDSSRDMETVYAAFELLRVEREDVELVLAGRGISTPLLGIGARYLGNLDYAQMPAFFSALDVGVVPNRDSDFSRYCFPQKFYEMAACGIPVVAAAVGEVARILERCANCLYRPGDAAGLASAVRNQLSSPQKPDVAIPTWRERAAEFEQMLRQVVHGG